MQTRKQDPDVIAEEAVGQRHGDPPPYAVKEQPDMSQEEIAWQLSKPAGPQASIPEKTAEARSASESETRMPTLAAPPREIPPGTSLVSLYRTGDQVR
jgi:hypothetical protein